MLVSAIFCCYFWRNVKYVPTKCQDGRFWQAGAVGLAISAHSKQSYLPDLSDSVHVEGHTSVYISLLQTRLYHIRNMAILAMPCSFGDFHSFLLNAR